MTSKNEYEGVDQRWKCLHLLAGTIEIPKRCLRNHECGCCGFDQWLEQAGPMPTRAPHISLAVRETLAA